MKKHFVKKPLDQDQLPPLLPISHCSLPLECRPILCNVSPWPGPAPTKNNHILAHPTSLPYHLVRVLQALPSVCSSSQKRIAFCSSDVGSRMASRPVPSPFECREDPGARADAVHVGGPWTSSMCLLRFPCPQNHPAVEDTLSVALQCTDPILPARDSTPFHFRFLFKRAPAVSCTVLF